jgi:hypothetical protein
MRKGICHRPFPLNCCFFPQMYSCKSFLHCIKATTPFNLSFISISTLTERRDHIIIGVENNLWTSTDYS